MGIGIGLGRRYVDHDRQVIVMENAVLTHDDLAAAQFFIRRTDEIDVDGKVFQVF